MNINPMDFLKNFQNIQAKMAETQEKLKELRVVGTAGGDMVRIEMDGQMNVTDVGISPEAIDPSDINMLEDLIQAGFSDAMAKIKEKIQTEMSGMTGGMGLPPGFTGQ